MVYISHSRQNSSAAYKLSNVLQSRQVKTWLDLQELDSGADWNEKVAEAIRNADAIVFLIGPPGPDDRGQQFEWRQVVEEEYYLDPAKTLIPVVIGDAELPAFLRTRKTISADTSSIDFEALAGAIVDSISKPGDSIDPAKLELGRQARELAQKNLREYSRELQEEDVKRAPLRGLK